MDDATTTQAKIEKPHAAFEGPHEVVIDPALSKEQKLEALDALEQDARQLATASDEGMSGGEPTNLHDVLKAKEALEMPPTEFAYAVVVKDLRSRLTGDIALEDRQAVQDALLAIEKLSAPNSFSGAAAQGVPKPGSAAEMDDELAREKLDP